MYSDVTPLFFASSESVVSNICALSRQVAIAKQSARERVLFLNFQSAASLVVFSSAQPPSGVNPLTCRCWISAMSTPFPLCCLAVELSEVDL